MEPEVAVVGGTTGGGVVRAGGIDVEVGGTLVVAFVDGGVVIVGGGIRSGAVVGGGNVGGGVVVVEVLEGENGDADGSVESDGGVTGCLFCVTNQPPNPSITKAAMT